MNGCMQVLQCRNASLDPTTCLCFAFSQYTGYKGYSIPVADLNLLCAGGIHHTLACVCADGVLHAVMEVWCEIWFE